MVQVDHRTQQKTIIRIESLPENLRELAGVCVLEDGDVFHCGGLGPMNSLYKINPQTRGVERLPPMPHADGCIVPVEVGGSVYIFTGWYKTSAYRFSLSEKRWYKLRTPPVSCEDSYTVHCNGHILVSGSSTSAVYEYSLHSNEYRKVFDEEGVLLRTESGELFLLSRDKKIYKSSERDWCSWE